jgi:hypothetical protein
MGMRRIGAAIVLVVTILAGCTSSHDAAEESPPPLGSTPSTPAPPAPSTSTLVAVYAQAACGAAGNLVVQVKVAGIDPAAVVAELRTDDQVVATAGAPLVPGGTLEITVPSPGPVLSSRSTTVTVRDLNGGPVLGRDDAIAPHRDICM